MWRHRYLLATGRETERETQITELSYIIQELYNPFSLFLFFPPCNVLYQNITGTQCTKNQTSAYFYNILRQIIFFLSYFLYKLSLAGIYTDLKVQSSVIFGCVSQLFLFLSFFQHFLFFFFFFFLELQGTIIWERSQPGG